MVVRRVGAAVVVAVLAVGVAGCVDERTSVSDACRLIDRGLAAHLVGGPGKGVAARSAVDSWRCGWQSSQGGVLDLNVRVFKVRKYEDDVRQARRAYLAQVPVGSCTRIKGLAGQVCWSGDDRRLEVTVRRHDVLAHISYQGLRPALRRGNVKNADIAKLLAQNLMKHL